MENISMTRISDLPEMNGGGGQHMGDSSYMPMNIHPNPYGLPQQGIGALPPQLESKSTQQEKNQPQNILYMASDFNEQQQRLPQRDIPKMMDDYTQDEQIQANYIPKPKKTMDYIDEYQETTNKKVREYENKKINAKLNESWFDEMRIPIMIGILYFVFQMPIINTLIFKRFSFLSIYNDDGNFNFYGLILKSTFFGSAFYTMNKCMELLEDL
jgi:hypothetical protein